MPMFGSQFGSLFDPDAFTKQYGATPSPQPTQPSGMMFSGLPPQPAAAAPAPKPSFFGEGGTGRAIAGSIGDALLSLSGKQAIYAPAMQQQDQQDFILKREAAQQAAEQQRQLAVEAYKRANPAPLAPHFWQTNDGSLAQVGPDGQPHVLYQDPTPKTTWLTSDNGDGTKQLIPMTANGPAGAGTAPTGGGTALPPGYTVRGKGGAASGPRSFPAETAYDAIVQHESNGRVGVTGPQTRYGRAQGLSQMLPATAQAMAGKLGLPWRPDLMTATTDTAAQYQRALGKAYFNEGLERTGNVHDAAQYYHAGPDKRLWGPKTRAYADGVVASLEA